LAADAINDDLVSIARTAREATPQAASYATAIAGNNEGNVGELREVERSVSFINLLN